MDKECDLPGLALAQFTFWDGFASSSRKVAHNQENAILEPHAFFVGSNLHPKKKTPTPSVLLKSFQSLGAEVSDGVVFDSAGNFDGLAADFAVFNVDLPAHGKIHDHRNLLPAVGTIEKMFHVEYASIKPIYLRCLLPNRVIPNPGRSRDKLREESLRV